MKTKFPRSDDQISNSRNTHGAAGGRAGDGGGGGGGQKPRWSPTSWTIPSGKQNVDKFESIGSHSNVDPGRPYQPNTYRSVVCGWGLRWNVAPPGLLCVSGYKKTKTKSQRVRTKRWIALRDWKWKITHSRHGCGGGAPPHPHQYKGYSR